MGRKHHNKKGHGLYAEAQCSGKALKKRGWNALSSDVDGTFGALFALSPRDDFCAIKEKLTTLGDCSGRSRGKKTKHKKQHLGLTMYTVPGYA